MPETWVTLGAGFPPTLNRDTPATELKPNETPSGYGYDLNRYGVIAAGSIPSGTSATIQTYTIGGTTYKFFYNRLWLASSTVLSYGAPEYTAAFLPQGLGSITFPEGSGGILAYYPTGGNDLAVLTPQGAYIVLNAINPDGDFQRGHLIQELALATASYSVELNGTVYVSNSTGLWALRGEEVAETTLPVRNNSTGFVSQALTADYIRGRVIGGSSFVYDEQRKALYDYATSGFLYTTPTLTNKDYRPMSVDRVGLVIEHGNANGGSVNIAVKVEDDEWTDPEGIQLPYQEGGYTRYEWPVNGRSCHRFAVRLTGLSSNIYIRQVQAQVQGYLFGDATK